MEATQASAIEAIDSLAFLPVAGSGAGAPKQRSCSKQHDEWLVHEQSVCLLDDQKWQV
jgi:hypothetical protein